LNFYSDPIFFSTHPALRWNDTHELPLLDKYHP